MTVTFAAAAGPPLPTVSVHFTLLVEVVGLAITSPGLVVVSERFDPSVILPVAEAGDAVTAAGMGLDRFTVNVSVPS